MTYNATPHQILSIQKVFKFVFHYELSYYAQYSLAQFLRVGDPLLGRSPEFEKRWYRLLAIKSITFFQKANIKFLAFILIDCFHQI